MRTKEKIIQAGTQCFASNGYKATTMSEIASLVGIKKPSLYAHYQNKEALFLDVFNNEIEGYLQFVQSRIDEKRGQSVKEQLQDLFLIHSINEDNEISTLFYYRFVNYPPAELKESILEQYRKADASLFSVLGDVWNEGKKRGEMDKELSNDHIYNTFFALIDGLANEMSLYDYKQMKERSELVWEVFWRGVKAPS